MIMFLECRRNQVLVEELKSLMDSGQVSYEK